MPSRDDFCPVAKSVQLVGDRWSLLLIREMLRGVQSFNEFERSVPGISRSTLAQRLQTLERSSIVERRAVDGKQTVAYRLTEAGRHLEFVVDALAGWGERWLVPDPRPAEIDPDGLMMWIRRHVALDGLPPHRIVVAFELQAVGGTHCFWLMLHNGEAKLCPEHPGFEEDLRVSASVTGLYDLFHGRVTLGGAINAGSIQIEGPPRLVKSFPIWFRVRP